MQPVFSPSVLAEMIRPDGSSTISVITGESLSAELAHEMMSIQVTAMLYTIPLQFHFNNLIRSIFSLPGIVHFETFCS